MESVDQILTVERLVSRGADHGGMPALGRTGAQELGITVGGQLGDLSAEPREARPPHAEKENSQKRKGRRRFRGPMVA